MTDTTSTRTFPSHRLEDTATDTPRRTTHSASGWTLPSGLQSLRQPQDGALTNGGSNTKSVVRQINGRLSNQIAESEDARLNGSLRSLARRVKGLNVISGRPADLMHSSRYPAQQQAVRKAPEAKRQVNPVHPQVA